MAGLTLAEVGIALVLVALVTVGVTRMFAENAENIKVKATAERMAQVLEATKNYVRARHDSIDQRITASGGGPITIPIAGGSCSGLTPSLQACGFLPASFQNVNPYNQTHDVGVRRTGSGILEVVVATEGGFPIPDRIVPRAAALVGPEGGYQSASTGAAAQGAYSGWQISNLSGSFSGINAGAGHLVANLGFENGSLITDYLYRVDVPGHPEANQMFTDLHLDGGGVRHNIDGVQTLSAVDGVFSNNVDAGNNITARNNITSTNGSVFADNGDVRSTRFVDSNNTGFVVDPASTSTMNRIDATIMYDRNNTAFYADPASTSMFNDMRASIYYDRDNTGYYVNPFGTSVLKDMYTRIIRDLDHGGYYLDPYGESYIWNTRIGARGGALLTDLLPNYIAKGGYVSGGAGNVNVQKPSCPGGGQPRIVVTPVGYNGVDNPSHSMTWASHNGGYWRVHSQYYGWQQSVRYGYVYSQTFCYYP